MRDYYSAASRRCRRQQEEADLRYCLQTQDSVRRQVIVRPS